MSNNSITQANEESVLFKSFLEAAPDFAHEVADWHLTGPGQDPPDVICTTVSGKHVGVEICQWAHEGAMKAGRLRDQINKNLLAAIGPQPVNTSEHFWLVVFHPRSNMRLSAGRSREAFRKAFLDLVSYVDKEWVRLEHYGSSAYHFRALKQFNPLHKYLDKVSFCPRNPALAVAVSKAFTELGDDTAILQTGDERTDWIVPIGHAQPVRTPYDKEQWEPDDNGNVTIEGSLLKLLKAEGREVLRDEAKNFL